MVRFFVTRENLKGHEGFVTGQEFQHMCRVLRLRPGDRVMLFDDASREHEGVIRAVSENIARIEILSSHDAGTESPLDLRLAVGLTKGEKLDLVVEKATELGVQTILPLATTYTVPKLDPEKISRRSRRWQKIALSAAKQCGRTRIPVILPVSDFGEFIRQPSNSALKLLFWEKEERQTLNDIFVMQSAARSMLLAVGPEGGFSVEEVHLARDYDFKPVGLGRRVLRVETAAIAVMALVQFLWGDLN
ncbi:MAG TPA: 16S rRNA (uracil(1498)-N(3))-methyltransferase [Terriglobales bacterium]|nr:16S rRNA (uracil(1498)-N(3))-methyltransferase [Terriglobales bacterium]